MRWFICGMALILFAAAARAEDTADQPILVLNTGGHTAPITTVLFTPDGKEVITVSLDKTVRRWDPATGERLGVLRPPIGAGGQGCLNAASLSPDGKTLAVAGAGVKGGEDFVFHVFLIDLADGSVTAALAGHKGTILSVAFSHDGKLVAAAGYAGVAYLWDAASGRLLHTLEGHKERIMDLAFSPDDRLLATGSFDNTARLWSVETGQEAAEPLKHEDKVYCVAWKGNGTLATGGAGLTFIHLWDRTGKHLKHFDKLRGRFTYVTKLAFLPGKAKEELFYTWIEPEGADVRKSGGAVLNMAGPGASRDGLTWENRNAQVCGAVSPDGTLAATAGEDDDGVALWTLRDGKPVRRLKGRGQTPYRVGWSPQGRAVGWTDALKPAAGAADLLQRSFALDQLLFDKKPDARYARSVPTLGGLGLQRDGANYLVTRDKAVVSTIKDANPGTVGWTWLPGDRVALVIYARVALYNARTGDLIRYFSGSSDRILGVAASPDGRYLLGACSDHTLRMWDVEGQDPHTGRPLLSLFVAGADWVAWTKEGYYAASPAGERLMGWQVNNGPDQLGTFHAASEFHKAFYRPDVIKRVLAEGSVAKALEAADKESGQTTQAVDVAQALPPEVTILSPAAGELKAAEVEVKAEAVSKGRPVVSLQLLFDGRPCPGAELKKFPGAKPGDKQEAAWKVTLPEGEHILNARAESDVSAAASPAVAVNYKKEADEPLPTLYVLAVGINAYPGSLKLNWAVDDANAVAKAFQAESAPKPFGKAEAKVLLDKDATKEGILAGLDWLKGKMTADDTAVVFYAGHGHRDRKSGQFYVLPVDVDPADLPGTGVTGTAIKDKLKAVPGRVLVLLDACHSGSIGQSPADPGSLTDDVQRQLAAPDCGVVVMCAAMAQEEAGEAAAVKHGFFTAALLSGLGGGRARQGRPDPPDGAELLRRGGGVGAE